MLDDKKKRQDQNIQDNGKTKGGQASSYQDDTLDTDMEIEEEDTRDEDTSNV